MLQCHLLKHNKKHTSTSEATTSSKTMLQQCFARLHLGLTGSNDNRAAARAASRLARAAVGVASAHAVLDEVTGVAAAAMLGVGGESTAVGGLFFVFCFLHEVKTVTVVGGEAPTVHGR